MDFSVSVIIPSYNGAVRISRLLHALEDQDTKDFETIIVIDGSTDNTAELLNQTDWNLNLQIIQQENKGRAGARNAGAEIANGKVLIFYDDDVEPHSDSVSLHIKTLQSGDISVGQQLEPINAKTEFGKYKAKLSRRWVVELGNSPIALTEKTLFLTAANMAIKKDVFLDLKGFDSKLRDAEDYDLAVRAFTKGNSIIFNPTNRVVHHAFDSCQMYISRQREYRKAHAILIAQRDDNPLYRKYEVKKTPSKKLIYFFVPGTTATAIDKGFFMFLPQRWRYGVYARIVSALSVYYPYRKL